MVRFLGVADVAVGEGAVFAVLRSFLVRFLRVVGVALGQGAVFAVLPLILGGAATRGDAALPPWARRCGGGARARAGARNVPGKTGRGPWVGERRVCCGDVLRSFMRPEC